jgi:hypothetical protein
MFFERWSSIPEVRMHALVRRDISRQRQRLKRLHVFSERLRRR